MKGGFAGLGQEACKNAEIAGAETKKADRKRGTQTNIQTLNKSTSNDKSKKRLSTLKEQKIQLIESSDLTQINSQKSFSEKLKVTNQIFKERC